MDIENDSEITDETSMTKKGKKKASKQSSEIQPENLDSEEITIELVPTANQNKAEKIANKSKSKTQENDPLLGQSEEKLIKDLSGDDELLNSKSEQLKAEDNTLDISSNFSGQNLLEAEAEYEKIEILDPDTLTEEIEDLETITGSTETRNLILSESLDADYSLVVTSDI